MDRYAVVTLSGSAGKTTSVTTYAVLLAQAGHRVRVYDMDAQANASTWLGYPSHRDKTIVDVLRQNATIADVELPARYPAGETDSGEQLYEPIPNLSIVPANRGTLDQLVVELPGITGGVFRLFEAVQDDESDVDIELYDCPGSLNVLVIAGILATAEEEDGAAPPNSWGVITCTKPAGKENEGIPALEKELRTIRRGYRVNIPLVGILPCAVPHQGGVYDEQMEDLIEGYGDLVAPKIRRASIVDEAYTNYTPLPLYGYRAKAVSDDYRAQLSSLQKRGVLLGKDRPADQAEFKDAATQ
ncbi:ParA family protein [Kribbella sp. NPDC051587]|uniref:ParA family protein n=1 Tax=Kribbella sp. NPDC051587 TaxID=3364119 RepID=UPI00379CEB3D